MDKRLQILERLYEASGADAEIAGDNDHSTRREAKAFKEMKVLLDKRPHDLPDTATLDAITAMAGREWRPKTSELRSVLPDRESLKPVRHARIYALRMVAAASVLFAVVAVGLWQFGAESPAQLDAVLADGDAPAAEQKSSEQDLQESSRDMFSVAEAEDIQPTFTAQAKDSIPTWSDPDDLMHVRRRVLTMRQNSRSLDWDNSLALEMMPVGGATSGFQQASTSRPVQRP